MIGVEAAASRAHGGKDDIAGHVFAGRALGSSLRLTVRRCQADEAREAWRAVVAEFAAVDASLSRFRGDSELTRLNRLAGSPGHAAASPRLRSAVALMDRARRVTGGRFDARVLGDLECLGEHGADLTASGAATHRPARPRRERVPVPDRPLDTGGIGKGLALRWAAARALGALPARAGMLLEAGGDLVAAGDSPPGGFLVGIEDPLAEVVAAADPVVVLRLASGAVATSSVRVRHWVDPSGEPVHHLVDPSTGRPARSGLLAVTVAGPDPAWSEVWSKALFIGGRGGIAEEARGRGLAAWWVDASGALGMSPAARERTAWAAEARIN